MQWIRSHLSFANAISMIALFVALGGTSIAAVSLSKNSVGAKQIKKNAVRAAEIKRNAVGASEVRSNAIAGGDLADGTIGSLDIGDNAIGSSELSDNSVGGSELAANAVTGADVLDASLTRDDLNLGTLTPVIRARQSGEVAVPDNTVVTAEVGCEPGELLIGGTAHLAGPVATGAENADARVTVSRPATDTTGVPNSGAVSGAPGADGWVLWRGTANAKPAGGGDTAMRVWAFCASY
jgi:hypothetical protein